MLNTDMAACLQVPGIFNLAPNASTSFAVAFGGFPQQDAGVLVFMAQPQNNGRVEVTSVSKQRFGAGLFQYVVFIKNQSNNAVQCSVKAGIACQ
jgi:hypothetical protein